MEILNQKSSLGLHKCWQWHTPGRPGGLVVAKDF